MLFCSVWFAICVFQCKCKSLKKGDSCTLSINFLTGRGVRQPELPKLRMQNPLQNSLKKKWKALRKGCLEVVWKMMGKMRKIIQY